MVAKNLHRRQLSLVERVAAAGRALPLLKAEAEARQKAGKKTEQGGKATDQAGKMFGVSGRSVARAERVAQFGIGELKEALATEVISLDQAASIAGAPPDKQRELLALSRASSPKGATFRLSPLALSHIDRLTTRLDDHPTKSAVVERAIRELAERHEVA